MSNTKGNAYPLWGINNKFQVFAMDSSQQVHAMSKENFAMDISISEDGTVWILTTEPDPDGGGAKLFWSNGDKNWHEIDTPEEGGVAIAGASGDNCFYLSTGGMLRRVNTTGQSINIYEGDLVNFDYGGGYFWAILPQAPGGEAILQFSSATPPFQFKPFPGNKTPFGLSVNTEGNCYGIEDFSSKYYSNNGTGTGSYGHNLDEKALQITFKGWSYIRSTEFGENGNRVYKWVDIAGGTFEPLKVYAVSIAASYHRNE